jgi:gas vesicle protein
MNIGRIHLKSLLLGIGIGIIITSVVSLIYMAGSVS